MQYNEINGDLIVLARKGEFDAISHGVNCFSNMGAGIAVAMKREFGCDKFRLENPLTRGDINKLGQIDYENRGIGPDKILTVINSYTQYVPSVQLKPLDYEALTLCMRKINHTFKGKRIGLPRIGAGLAGGDWMRIKEIIKTELVDCDVTIVMKP